jgi:hypothetical protein
MADQLSLCREISVVDSIDYKKAIDTVCVQSAERFNEKVVHVRYCCGLKGVTGVTLERNRNQKYF